MEALSISVVIPVYNCEKYVGRAIQSVLDQTQAPGEIIVVDDGSTDNTVNAVRSFGDRVVLLQQANAGVSAARNAGIQQAKGNWIGLLDGDDQWLPEKLQWQTALLNRNPHLAWTTGNYIECLCDENRRAAHTLPDQSRRYLSGKDYYDSYFDAIRRLEWGHTNCMLIQKDVFSSVGLFSTDLPKANDIDMWLRIAYRYPAIGFSSEPLAIYHLSPANSIVKKYRKTAIHADFMTRHFQLAESQGVLDPFLPAAGAIMRRWIRGMLFEGRKEEIRELLTRFPQAFTPFYRGLIGMLTLCPSLTARLLHGLSKGIRAGRFRRRVTRRPAKLS
jgi:glycosyltransferase involved in cell wall biosynthesis